MAENLTFAGFDTVALAKKYGTPLYVMSEDIIRDRIKAIRKAFDLVPLMRICILAPGAPRLKVKGNLIRMKPLTVQG